MAGLHLIRNENNFEKGRGGGGLQSNPAVYFGNFWRFSGQRARFRERVPTILQLVVAEKCFLNSHASKTYGHMKGFTLSLTFKLRINFLEVGNCLFKFPVCVPALPPTKNKIKEANKTLIIQLNTIVKVILTFLLTLEIIASTLMILAFTCT